MKRQRRILSNILKNSQLTDFERSVYKAVSTIPKGQVRSYKWVAEKIGNPKSVRAIGTVLNKNPHTITIPCHRVIKSDGSIGGYSKGVRAKLRLLRSEGIAYI